MHWVFYEIIVLPDIPYIGSQLMIRSTGKSHYRQHYMSLLLSVFRVNVISNLVTLLFRFTFDVTAISQGLFQAESCYKKPSNLHSFGVAICDWRL